MGSADAVTTRSGSMERMPAVVRDQPRISVGDAPGAISETNPSPSDDVCQPVRMPMDPAAVLVPTIQASARAVTVSPFQTNRFAASAALTSAAMSMRDSSRSVARGRERRRLATRAGVRAIQPVENMASMAASW